MVYSAVLMASGGGEVVLVTGATGFLGGRLVRLLCRRGYRVRAGCLPGDSRELLAGLPCRQVELDVTRPETLEPALAGVSVVFHVAALVSFQPRLYRRQQLVNVSGTANLLAAARRAGVKRFVHTSTVNTLGVPPAGRLGDESTPYDWQGYGLGYMDSKREAERVVLAAAACGFDALCLLPATMFGPGDINFNAGSYVRLAARGLARLVPPGGTTVAHVDDVAQGHLLAWQRGRAGRRYILGGEPMSYRAIFTIICRELGRRPPVGTVSARLLRAAGGVGELVRRWSGWPVPLGRGLVRAACSDLYYSSSRAERELGYTWRPAARAIADAVAWYRARRLV